MGKRNGIKLISMALNRSAHCDLSKVKKEKKTEERLQIERKRAANIERTCGLVQ